MLYPARWRKITVDQSKVLKNQLYRLFRFWGATWYNNRKSQVLKSSQIVLQSATYEIHVTKWSQTWTISTGHFTTILQQGTWVLPAYQCKSILIVATAIASIAFHFHTESASKCRSGTSVSRNFHLRRGDLKVHAIRQMRWFWVDWFNHTLSNITCKVIYLSIPLHLDGPDKVRCNSSNWPTKPSWSVQGLDFIAK